jgi:RNA polymerase sigma factor (sigma-70 family)
MYTEHAPDNDAISILYTGHHGWLQGWLRKKLGCAQQAADLAQDTFMRVIVSRNVNEVREPRAYLSTIAHGLVVNHFRRADLERAYLETLENLPQPQAPSPETTALVLEALSEISRILDRLPARAQEIFLLSQLDGLTYPQIAERFGVTVNTVQKSMIKTVQHCYAAIYA